MEDLNELKTKRDALDRKISSIENSMKERNYEKYIGKCYKSNDDESFYKIIESDSYDLNYIWVDLEVKAYDVISFDYDSPDIFEDMTEITKEEFNEVLDKAVKIIKEV